MVKFHTVLTHVPLDGVGRSLSSLFSVVFCLYYYHKARGCYSSFRMLHRQQSSLASRFCGLCGFAFCGRPIINSIDVNLSVSTQRLVCFKRSNNEFDQ